MTYINTYTGEEYEDFSDCRDGLIMMQEAGKAELLDILEWAVHDKGEGDREYAAMLRAGMDFIKDCIRFARGHIEFDVMGIDDVFIDPYIKETEEDDE